LLAVDYDFDLDPPPVIDEVPVTATPIIPEASADLEAATTIPSVIVLPGPPAPPTTSEARKDVESSAAAASGDIRMSPVSVSIDVSLEDAVVEGLKGSLVKASEMELRLRELVSDAEMMKTKMHVSTYVSPLPIRCSPQGSE
jgi:hypothetical protein